MTCIRPAKARKTQQSSEQKATHGEQTSMTRKQDGKIAMQRSIQAAWQNRLRKKSAKKGHALFSALRRWAQQQTHIAICYGYLLQRLLLLGKNCILLVLLHVDSAVGATAALPTRKQLHYTTTANYATKRPLLSCVVMLLRHHYWPSAHHDGVPPWCETATRCSSQPQCGQFLSRRLRQPSGLYARQVCQPVRECLCRSCNHTTACGCRPLATPMCGCLLFLLRRRCAACLCHFECTASRCGAGSTPKHMDKETCSLWRWAQQL